MPDSDRPDILLILNDDMVEDRTETNDLAEATPALVDELSERWWDWAERCGVLAWEEVTGRRC